MGDEVSFTWGDKGGPSKTKGVQFYKNFKYDEITYNLFDNVYLFKDNDREPHIGKIVKIWGHVNGNKKVKIVWFFHPFEIQNHLGEYQPSDKEVFLACGENEVPGVADINPLEAIAGKCCIICTLKDERNTQPSQEDIESADFIFSKLFDAKKCILTDELPDEIASNKIEFFLNKKEDLNKKVPSAISNGAAESISGTLSSSPIPVPPELNALKISGTETNGPRQEQRNSLKIHIPSIRKEDGQSNSIQSPGCAREEKKTDGRNNSTKAPVGVNEEKKENLGTLNEDMVAKRIKLSKDASGASEASKNFEKMPVLSKRILKNGDKTGDLEEVPRKRTADGKFKGPAVSTGGMRLEKKADHQVEAVSRRQIDSHDRTKWFDYSGMNWSQRIQKEDQEGKVVLLENFDALITSLEMEDLIFRATQNRCTVRLVTNYMYGDHTYGMAYASFKSKEAADRVVEQLNEAHLVLPDGRPLLCSKGTLKIPKQATSFLGHLAIEKLKKKMTGEEMKKAVSTAHCSQSNTIEFEMALEWIVAEDKFEKASKRLTKLHQNEREKIMKK